MDWLRDPAVAWFVPVPLLVALAPLLWRVFRTDWLALDRAAAARRAELAAAGRLDLRLLVAPALGVFVLALQEYFGKAAFFGEALRPMLASFEQAHPGGPVGLATWGPLYAQLWWGVTRIVGYLLPIAIWPLLFPDDRRLDCGLRVAGLGRHLWVYAVALAVMVPLLLVVQHQPDFGAYYPFYRGAGRSWGDFLAWEATYLVQFFALEAFFRGWWLHATRSLGAASILGMVVPYTMIHFGKPWLEVSGAIVAGVVLGSLSARTRSIWAGFLVHATVALSMDVLSLQRRGELPTRAWPGSASSLTFGGWSALLPAAWLCAMGWLAFEGWRRWRLPRQLPTVLLLACAALAACSSSSPAPREPVPPWDGSRPPATCTPPVALADVSAPTTVVGTGTPASCTATALQAAAAAGGTIVFACGASPVTIPITSTIVFRKESVLDGGSLVTLSGQGATRILLLDSGYDQATPRLTVQRLVFQDGHSARVANDDTASGGAAIYRDGGSLTVIDCAFLGNHAPASGPDLAGGAIYAFGGGETVIVGSTFIGNSASDGGAVGSLNGDLTIVNSSFSGNQARGSGGNPGQGGCGGSLYQDGGAERTTLCGVTIRGSSAGAIGGGVFRVSNSADGTFTMDRSTVDGSVVTPAGSGNAGGLYLEGLQLTITSTTISRNRAFYNGGLWINAGHADLTNVTVAENVATGSNGGGLWLGHAPGGTLLNVTIASNHAVGKDQVAGAIFGAGLTLRNTLISGNTAMWSPVCDVVHADGGGNLQWPDQARCTASPALGDPLLGPLGPGAGTTETMAPGAASPARRLGIGCPATDQRGQPRGSPCTAGAVEVP